MPAIKIHLPAKLPDRDLTETQFDIWWDRVQTYLSQDPDIEHLNHDVLAEAVDHDHRYVDVEQ